MVFKFSYSVFICSGLTTLSPFASRCIKLTFQSVNHFSSALYLPIIIKNLLRINVLLEDLKVVIKVAECRSITAAAIELDMRTATASAAVKRVEKSLGFELFTRTTRQLRLSTSGEKYLPQCEQAMAMLDKARQSMKDDLDIIDGDIRIALSSDLGRNVVTPWLDEIMDKHPNLKLRVNITDSNVDFYRDSIDIALRYGSPNDANVYGFKICDVPRVLCASPDYLEQAGSPKHPNDLVNHQGLLYQLYDILHSTWQFTKGKQQFKVKISGKRASNDGDLVRRWCVAGKGIALKSCLDMSNDLLSGKVQGLLKEYQAEQTELWLIFPSRQSITPAARLIRDMLQTNTDALLKELKAKQII
ncbi:transcriptional regulator [Vibrio sp. JCM 19236]|nr:transcriptional regulator [Vibrio sp. JCM 19236]